MGKCHWKPAEGLPGAEDYPGCPYEGYLNNLCIFHLSLDAKRNHPEMVDEFKKAFDAFFVDKALLDDAVDFRGFSFPDRIDLDGLDFRRSYERGETGTVYPEEHKPVDLSWAVFGEEVRLDGASFGAKSKFARCKFEGLTRFDKATFGDQTNFRESIFGDHTSFREAEFGLFVEFSEAQFGNETRFDHANFAGNAGFEHAKFKDSTSFVFTNFNGGARFTGATFGKKTDFGQAIFGDSVHFDETKFVESTAFSSAQFGDDASFEEAYLGDEANFDLAQFANKARFCSANFGSFVHFFSTFFNGPVDFTSSKFGSRADFGKAIFFHNAIFEKANFGNFLLFESNHFHGHTDFSYSTFGDSVTFFSIDFRNNVRFEQVRFGEDARFTGAEFHGMVSFRHIYGQEKILYCLAEQENEGKGLANSSLKEEFFRRGPAYVTFRQSTFDKFAIFQDTDLSRVTFQQVKLKYLSFLNSQISKTNFISCHWGTGPENRRYARWERPWRFAFLRPRLLLDELICRDKAVEEIENKKNKKLKKEQYDEAIRKFQKEPFIKHPTIDNRVPQLDIQPSDIEVLTLQLKQSLEATRDPITAGDFHFAVMEMKREQAMASNRHWRARMLRAYKFISGYGERYGRTALWLLFLLLISTSVFANFNVAKIIEGKSYWERLDPAAFYSLQHVLPFKLGTAGINEVHKVSSLMGWLTVIETIVGTTLFTFFALALRRRFKR